MIAPTQLELAPPPAAHRDVAWLEQVLREHGGWLTAAQLTDLAAGRLHDRALRELASASEWIISGQRGYKHLDRASPEEIHHAAAWLESQAKKMAERAGALRRNAHRLFG